MNRNHWRALGIIAKFRTNFEHRNNARPTRGENMHGELCFAALNIGAKHGLCSEQYRVNIVLCNFAILRGLHGQTMNWFD